MNYWSIINNYCLFKLKLFKLISLPRCWFSCENRFTSFTCWSRENLHNNLEAFLLVWFKKILAYHQKQRSIPTKSQNQAFSTCFLIIMLQILLGLWNRVSNWYFLNAEPKSVTRKKIQQIKKKTGSNQIHSSKLGEHDSRFRIGIWRDSHMERTEARRYIKLEWGRNCRFSSLLGCLE